MYGMTLSQMAQANGMDEAGFKEYILLFCKRSKEKQEIVGKDIGKEKKVLTISPMRITKSICTGKWNDQR